MWIGHGQCIEQYGPGEPYLPVLAALGRLCRGPAGAHFLTWLRQHAPSWLARMPALLPVADRDAVLRLAGDTFQGRMLRELAEALEGLTTEQPLVLVLEDVHWSDAATLEWLAYVARRPDPARLLVLATYRPAKARDAAHPVHALTQELLVRHQGAVLAVGRLAAPEVALYVARCFGEGALVGRLAPVLHQRTQGHALFLVTMVADLQQRGVVQPGADGWELAAPLDPTVVEVPETLRAPDCAAVRAPVARGADRRGGGQRRRGGVCRGGRSRRGRVSRQKTSTRSVPLWRATQSSCAPRAPRPGRTAP